MLMLAAFIPASLLVAHYSLCLTPVPCLSLMGEQSLRWQNPQVSSHRTRSRERSLAWFWRSTCSHGEQKIQVQLYRWRGISERGETWGKLLRKSCSFRRIDRELILMVIVWQSSSIFQVQMYGKRQNEYGNMSNLFFVPSIQSSLYSFTFPPSFFFLSYSCPFALPSFLLFVLSFSFSQFLVFVFSFMCVSSLPCVFL